MAPPETPSPLKSAHHDRTYLRPSLGRSLGSDR
jgi:hypothetical protein